MNCSVQPIYSCFGSMQGLTQQLFLHGKSILTAMWMPMQTEGNTLRPSRTAISALRGTKSFCFASFSNLLTSKPAVSKTSTGCMQEQTLHRISQRHSAFPHRMQKNCIPIWCSTPMALPAWLRQMLYIFLVKLFPRKSNLHMHLFCKESRRETMRLLVHDLTKEQL